MSSNFDSYVDIPVPDSFGAGVSSIAVIGPDQHLRQSVCAAFSGFYEGEMQEFQSYPEGLDEAVVQLGQSRDVVLIELDSSPEFALELVEAVCSKGTATVMVYPYHRCRSQWF